MDAPLATVFTQLFAVISKAMDHIPTYEQRKAKRFHHLLTSYQTEMRRDYRSRDDNLLDNLRDDLYRHAISFGAELESKS